MSGELHPFDQIRVWRLGREAEVFLACERVNRLRACIGEEHRILGISMGQAARAMERLGEALRKAASE